MSKKHRSSGAWLISYPVITYRREEAVDCGFSVRVVEVGKAARQKGEKGHNYHHAVEQKARPSPWPVEVHWPFYTSLLSGCLVPPSDNALAESRPKRILRKTLRSDHSFASMRTDCRGHIFLRRCEASMTMWRAFPT